MTQEKMQLIDDLVTHERHCVLATTDGIEPLCSLMTLFVDHAAMKFYFLSRKDSRKNINIKKHPHVSILIDRRDQGVALTVQGVYAPIKRAQTVEAITKMFLRKYPELEEFANHPDTELLRVNGQSAQLIQGVNEKFSTKLKNS
ncbi:pyridoxamine 5'-phosphate oxidase family protein [Pseudodesulfovibrio cashew]|uniref:Pyridoxamine 5'-phosphate oxidase family protein n=1 Tax=Pseudodesulfovibrio cashew TaxID=2678688 RepID=A0A6I6J7S8_9BACT|nr:pyridoxamine 5'-phosphate oxidase family protein [Pseudodesulfovibrio cashew]QGY38886.1 pyridoxamine 5'-phosphate oxidase family protein [Pseudodesulfovibrio cashew]